MAPSPNPTHHPRRTPNTARHLHQHLQPPPASPITAPPSNTGHHLQHPPQSHPADNSHNAHYRVRHDKVDKAGSVTLRHNSRLHHIGIGKHHSGTYVVLLVDDLHIRIINAATGEVLRDLTLDTTRDYQPTGKPPGPPPKTKRPGPA